MNQFSKVEDWLNDKSAEKLIDLGLERIGKVAQLAFRETINKKSFPYIITIAGTNGKGTTGFLLSQLCSHFGVKNGWFSSPHILRFNERIQIDGKPLTTQEIIDSLEKIENHRVQTGVKLSYFEYATLAAIDLFISQKVKVMVMEVGLGGRLDAVNILDANIAIITSIGIDHIHHLGGTKAKIATEKAGILRENQIALLGENAQQTEIIQKAKGFNIELHRVKKEIKLTQTNSDLNQFEIKLKNSNQKITINLPEFINSRYQLSNSALAVSALLKSNLVDSEKLQTEIDLRGIQFMGRAHKFKVKKLTYTVDIAHNKQAIDNFLSGLDLNHKGQYTAILTVLKDKNYKSFIRAIDTWVDCYYLVSIDYERTVKSIDLMECIQKFSRKPIFIFGSANEAIQSLNQKYNNDSEAEFEVGQGTAKQIFSVGCFALAERMIPILENLTQKKN